MAAEPPKRKPSSSGESPKRKQVKNHSALQTHLRKIGDRINIISRRVSGTWSDAELSLISAVASLIQDSIQNNSAINLPTIATIVGEFELDGLGLDDIYSELMALLSASLPGQVMPAVMPAVEDSSEDDSSEDELPEERPASVQRASEERPASGRRRRRRALPPDGSVVLVTLTNTKAKGRIAKLLKNGPRKLTITGASAGTVNFTVTNNGVKSTTASIERSNVTIQVIERVSEPDELEPLMLVQVQWDPDPKYYTVRYSPGLNSDRFVTEDVAEPTEEQIYPFDEDEDEWRYPVYPVFSYGDKISVLTPNGYRAATVTDVLEGDHSYICEYDVLTKGETKKDGQIRLDVWYQQAKNRQDDGEISSDGEYSVPEEDEEDPALYDEGDTVEYQGERFKISTIESDDAGYNYMLISKSGAAINVSENMLEEQWIPKYQHGEEIVFGDAVAVVISIDYSNQTYDIQMESDDSEHSSVQESDMSDVPVLAYTAGTPVFYNYEFCTVLSASLTYTLQTPSGSELVGITEDNLHDWIMFIDPKTSVQTIYHIARRKKKSISRKGGKESRLYYEVTDSAGKHKDIMASSPNIKEQEDAASYFEDAQGGEGALEERIVFQPGDNVIIYDKGGDRHGIIRHHNATANIDDETYDIDIDGHVETFSVEEFGPEEESLSAPESEDGDFSVTKEQLESSSSDDSDEDSDGDDSSTFSEGEYVTFGEDNTVYMVVSVEGNEMYTISSSWEGAGPEVDGVSVENLERWSPQFEENQPVMHGEDRHIISEVHDDGTYVLDNGEEVTENELVEEVPILPNGTIVRCVGSKDVYKVMGHQSCGNYKLKNIFNKDTRLEVDEDVMVHEEPEYEKGDFVEMSDGVSREIKAFNKTKWSYKLEGIDRPVSEAEISTATYEPEFEKGDEVVFDGEVYTIKKVVRSRKSYILNNGAEVHENLLNSTEDE